MELHQLRYFIAVECWRSFTRAAEHEHVAQPSLSQQIRKLEDELGAPLFNRRGRKVTLTAFGERFKAHARRVLEEIDAARQEVAELRGLRRGSVTVGAIPTVAPYLLPRILAGFARACPGIAVSVREGLTASLEEQLLEGAIDLGIVGLPPHRAEFEAEPLFEDRMLLAVSKRHRLWRARTRRVALRDLADEPFLLLQDGHCFRSDVLKLCERSRLNPHVVFEGGQFDTLVALAATGAGITLIPEMARAHYRRAGIGLVEFTPPAPARTVGVVRLRERFVSPAAGAFLQHLKEAYADEL